MSKLNENAFAIMAMCEETKKPFGITVNNSTFAIAVKKWFVIMMKRS